MKTRLNFTTLTVKATSSLSIEKFVGTKIFIHREDKLEDDVGLKIAMILVRSVIKDDGKLHPQLFREEAFF